jgi:hypothetical protein
MVDKAIRGGGGGIPWGRFVVVGALCFGVLGAVLQDSTLPYRLMKQSGLVDGDAAVPEKVLIAKQHRIYADFDSFFPFYLEQHSQPGTKLSHAVGTGILTLLLLANPPALVAIASTLATGLVVAPYFVTQTTSGAQEALTASSAFVVVLVSLAPKKNSTRTIVLGLLCPLVGYGFAWYGHFFVEKNRPATFIYPAYSLLGDFKMFYLVITQRISI